MVTLPLKSVHQDDNDLVSEEVICLSQLARNNFPVAAGLVIFPPDLELNKILDRHGRIFEDNSRELKKQLQSIPMPEELVKEDKNTKINLAQAWEMVLERWWQQVGKSYSINRKANLKAQYILLTDKIKASGFGYINSKNNDIAINVTFGEITQSQKSQLEDLVSRAQKQLMFKMRFDWIIDSDIKIIKVSRLEDFVLKPDFVDVNASTLESMSFKGSPKTKLILNLSENFVIDPKADSVIIYSDNSTESEHKLFKIVESAKTYPRGEIIYRLLNKSLDSHVLKGVALLNSNQRLLNQEVMLLNLARNGYLLTNVHLGIPHTQNLAEFKHFSEALAKLGIKRSATFKYYLEISTVENVLNLEEFLDEIDSVIFDLDSINLESKAISKLLLDPIEKLNLKKIPFIVKSHQFDEDIVRFLTEHGVSGLIVTQANVTPMQEMLSKVESSLVSQIKH